MLTRTCQPRPTPSNGIFTSRYQKNFSSQLFCYLLSLTPMLMCKYWLLKVQTLITWNCDIPPGDQHPAALRMYWVWWLGLLRQERFLINSPRCRDLQLRRSCPGPQSNRWETCNEKLQEVPLRADFSRYAKQQFRKPNLCYICYYSSLHFRVFFCFPIIMQLWLCGINTLTE